ncbi:MAG: hypothetical protein MUP19_11755 [Candidatus Aminicenantes bacterium]|nr:hypothetical protein [Candidatus Aminicenantes bacterium]
MTGLSAQVQHKGLNYYVQTQDHGPQAKYIESLIYRSGKLLTSRKTTYTSFLGLPDFKEKVAQIMHDQHERILRDISEGKFDHFFEPGEK